jgi:uncharacterized protein (DUF2461 family)
MATHFEPELFRFLRDLKSHRRTCALEGEAVVRPPRGFPPDHPLIDDIKRKDFTAITRWTEEAALSPKFMAQLTAFCRTATPFMRFLAKALELEY